MPCDFHRSEDGSLIYVICSRGARQTPPCHYCGKPSTTLCDYPMGNGKTCDKAMCNNCKTHIGRDLDVCKDHSNPDDILIIQQGR